MGPGQGAHRADLPASWPLRLRAGPAYCRAWPGRRRAAVSTASRHPPARSRSSAHRPGTGTRSSSSDHQSLEMGGPYGIGPGYFWISAPGSGAGIDLGVLLRMLLPSPIRDPPGARPRQVDPRPDAEPGPWPSRRTGHHHQTWRPDRGQRSRVAEGRLRTGPRRGRTRTPVWLRPTSPSPPRRPRARSNSVSGLHLPLRSSDKSGS